MFFWCKMYKKTKYYWMAGDNVQDVYTQTVCPYSYFQVLGIVSSQPLKQNQISLSSLNTVTGVITFDYPYLDHVSYLSIKALIGNEEIYYQPLQIVRVCEKQQV